MSDATHAPDTLFLVMEEDWRLYPQEARVDAKAVVEHMSRTLPRRQGSSSSVQTWLNEGGATGNPYVDLDTTLINPHTRGGEPIPLPDRGGEERPRTDEPFASVSRSTFEGALGAEVPRVRKPKGGGKGKEVCEEVKDLMKMCTIAHRQGVGHLVWLSWEASNKRGYKCQIGHGSTLVAVSVEGAKRLKAAFAAGSIEKGHFDLVLLQWLRDRGAAAAHLLGASYVYPAVGSYVEHQSGCDPGIGRRESSWTKTWVQPGTRATGPDDRNRWLCGFTGERKGNPKWIQEIVLPETEGTDLRWFSLGNVVTLDSQEQAGEEEADPEARSRSRGNRRVQFDASETWPQDWQQQETKRGHRNYRLKMVFHALRNFTTRYDEVAPQKNSNIYMLCYNVMPGHVHR